MSFFHESFQNLSYLITADLYVETVKKIIRLIKIIFNKEVEIFKLSLFYN